jgi:hypothetical protein
MYIHAEQGEPIPTTSIEEIMPEIISLGKVATLNGVLSVIAMSERGGGVDLEYLKNMAGRRLLEVNQNNQDEPGQAGRIGNVDDLIGDVLGGKNGD